MRPLVTAELIRRYLAGELDDATMHALEKQALSDPFLAEALEGYAAHDPDQRNAQATLEALLAERVNAAAEDPDLKIAADIIAPAASMPAPAAKVAARADAARMAPPPPEAKIRRFDYRWAAAAAVLLLLAVGGYQWLQQGKHAGTAPLAQQESSFSKTQDSTAVITTMEDKNVVPSANADNGATDRDSKLAAPSAYGVNTTTYQANTDPAKAPAASSAMDKAKESSNPVVASVPVVSNEMANVAPSANANNEMRKKSVSESEEASKANTKDVLADVNKPVAAPASVSPAFKAPAALPLASKAYKSEGTFTKTPTGIDSMLAGRMSGVAVTQPAPGEAYKARSKAFSRNQNNINAASRKDTINVSYTLANNLASKNALTNQGPSNYFSNFIPPAPKPDVAKEAGYGLVADKSKVSALSDTVATMGYAAKKRSALAGDVASKPAAKNIGGVIVDDNNQGIPYATIRFKTDKRTVQTDINGHFSLPADSVHGSQMVEITSVGFQSKDTMLYATSGMHPIQLKAASAALNEVVIATKSAVDAAPYQAPSPQNGYDSLHQYLDNRLQNIGAPDGKLRLIFTVTPTGDLKDFKVISGISDFVDEQVIEFLKEGPAWKPASDHRPAKVKIAVKVQAPKK